MHVNKGTLILIQEKEIDYQSLLKSLSNQSLAMKVHKKIDFIRKEINNIGTEILPKKAVRKKSLTTCFVIQLFAALKYCLTNQRPHTKDFQPYLKESFPNQNANTTGSYKSGFLLTALFTVLTNSETK